MAGYTDKAQFEKVLTKFIEKMQADSEVANLCKGIKVTMGFDIYEPDVSFHFEFMNGVVSGGLGQATPPSMVFLEMSSETFDGMMTGEVDGASAAMSGEMTFSGDMSAAMGLQAMGDGMNRVYQEAKHEVLG
jgi:hypothetical protein